MTKLYLAPAKVNLHLAITGMLEKGYHELDTSFVYVDAHDVLSIQVADDLAVTCSDQSINGEENLVFQVLSAFRKEHAVYQGLKVYIDKKLPSQAGLGGGSSDAATALMVANQLWNINASRTDLIRFSAPFGADIPCFIFGKASLAKGIGDKLIPYSSKIPTEHVVLAWPGTGVSTAAAFKHFDEKIFHALTDEKAKAKVRARSDTGVFELGYNDLEKSASLLCSPLKALLSTMRAESIRAWMSGSGSACVALCNSKEGAQSLVDVLQQKGLVSWVHIGHFVQKHPYENKIGA